jgi:membrane protein implicated in regulation of membrane protease activity
MVWWLWVLLGIALLALEMVTPGGLFAMFFGLGAIAVAPLALLGAPPVVQWIAFSAVSIALLAFLRQSLRERLAARAAPPIDALVGEEAVLLEDLAAGGEAKAELRGTPWSARAASGIALRKGQRARVERVDGLVLWLRAE